MKTTQAWSDTSTNDIAIRPLQPDVREGDWISYKKHLETIQNGNVSALGIVGEVILYKRACALAYLGRRAQLYGGVCSRTQPRVLTAEFVTELNRSNCSQRFSRYPWLETLMKLLMKIEQLQDAVVMGSNVISLVPTIKGE